MILAKTMDAARDTRHMGELFNGAQYWRSDYFGHAKSDAESPQAFFVEQSPDSVVPPHFHEVNQFQVVVGGSGTLGRHKLSPIAIHYTGEFTGYGPLTAHADGIDYFTLRPNSDAGAQFFPEAKERIRLTPARRNVLGEKVALTPSQSLAEFDGVQTEDLLPGYSDGLGAWLLRLGAGATTKCVAPTSGGGQYLLVLGGTLKHRGVEYTRQACLYLTRDEPPLILVAGGGGLEALTLQFPRIFAAA